MNELTLPEFIEKYDIGLGVVSIPQRTDGMMGDMPKGSHHYLCILSYQDKRMQLEYTMGSGFERGPTCADVLDSLVSDVRIKWHCVDLADFMDEYGYEDEEAATRIYEACVANADKLIDLLGEKLVEELVYSVEPY